MNFLVLLVAESMKFCVVCSPKNQYLLKGKNCYLLLVVAKSSISRVEVIDGSDIIGLANPRDTWPSGVIPSSNMIILVPPKFFDAGVHFDYSCSRYCRSSLSN